MSSEIKLIKVRVVALVEEQSTNSPIVILYDEATNNILPIWVGEAEARAIVVALNKIDTPRPLTHELLLAVISKCGGSISKIAIDGLKDHTYYATLYIDINGKTVTVDARPSDLIALALTTDAPVFVAKVIMDEAAHPDPFPTGMPGMQRVHGSAGLKPNTQAKKEFSPKELEDLQELLKKARKREESQAN